MLAPIGVRLRPLLTPRGPRISPMASWADPLRSAHSLFGLSGLFNNLTIKGLLKGNCEKAKERLKRFIDGL